MACKFLVATLRPWVLLPKLKALPPKIHFPQTMTVRSAGHLLPPSQYDTPFPTKMKPTVVLRNNWEIIPLFAVTMTSLTLLAYATIWSMLHKVDVVFKTHSRKNLSRTMNLMRPEAHKVFLIEQTYEPWPEMYAVLEKMKQENCKRAMKNA